MAVPATLFLAAMAFWLICLICSAIFPSVSPYVTVAVACRPRYLSVSYPVLLRKVSYWASPAEVRSTRFIVNGVMSAVNPIAFGSSVFPSQRPDVRPDLGILFILPWHPRKSSFVSAPFEIHALDIAIILVSSAKTVPTTVIALCWHCDPHCWASSFVTMVCLSSPGNMLSKRYGSLPIASSCSCRSQS